MPSLNSAQLDSLAGALWEVTQRIAVGKCVSRNGVY
jgi:hypothetical protein